MRLAAVFLEDQNRPNRGYTVNFGANYFYEISLTEKECWVLRSKNKIFIEDFFDSEETLTNVSAIVGENGCGKTTLINELINHFSNQYRSGFSIWEKGTKTFIKDYSFYNHPIRTNKFSLEKLDFNFDTVYYSPFIDHKQPANGIDISADRYLERDLQNIRHTFDANQRVLIPDRLKRADYNRFIKFQQSSFSDSIKVKYGLLNEELYRVIFIRHEIDADLKKINFNNTPTDFREYLNSLFKQIREEYDNFNRRVSNDQERYELNKKQIKNFILMDLFCLLIRLMERSNFYLEEGKFLNETESDSIINSSLTPLEKFRYWLENYYYTKGEKNPLPHEETLEILDYLYGLIDSFKYSEDFNQLDWSNKSLYLNETELNELLNLNEKLLLALPRYYLGTKSNSLKKSVTYDDIRDLQYFISPEFASRRLSSGETAMLNLYSKIYDYFRMNVLITPIRDRKDFYLLFLDEADLGYHPSWKVSFVNSIVDFCKSFFAQFESRVQIVFSTHDALSLSDIPNTNIIYLVQNEDHFPFILESHDPSFPKKSFAANVTDLLSSSFFLKNGLLGDFAKNKIQVTIDWLEKLKIDKEKNKTGFNEPDPENKKLHRNIIDLIDEPILRYKLDEMYYDIFQDDIDKEKALDQIKSIARKAGLNDLFNDL